MILRSNPAPKSSETKCDINHISRLGHIWESDMIIWNGGGSERQSSDGRRVASFDLTALIFQWTTTCLIRCGTKRSGPGCPLSWGSTVWQQDQEPLCRWRWKKADTHGAFFCWKCVKQSGFVMWCDVSNVCYSRLIQHQLLLSRKVLTRWNIQVAQTHSVKIRHPRGLFLAWNSIFHYFGYLIEEKQTKIALTEHCKCLKKLCETRSLKMQITQIEFHYHWRITPIQITTWIFYFWAFAFKWIPLSNVKNSICTVWKEKCCHCHFNGQPVENWNLYFAYGDLSVT